MANSKRDETAYINQPLLDGIEVLLALEGLKFEPVTIQRMQQRTGLSYGKCRSALITLKQKRLAKKNELGHWSVGPRMLSFSERLHELCLAAVTRAERSGDDV